MQNIKQQGGWLYAKYKPTVKRPFDVLLGVVGKKARFICDLNTGFQLKLKLNT